MKPQTSNITSIQALYLGFSMTIGCGWVNGLVVYSDETVNLQMPVFILLCYLPFSLTALYLCFIISKTPYLIADKNNAILYLIGVVLSVGVLVFTTVSSLRIRDEVVSLGLTQATQLQDYTFTANLLYVWLSGFISGFTILFGYVYRLKTK